MISSSPTAKTTLEQSTSIQSGIGCIVEYNLNSMVDNITVTGNDYVKSDGSTPFKKLFPLSSIIKPFRPVGAGVKYEIGRAHV